MGVYGRSTGASPGAGKKGSTVNDDFSKQAMEQARQLQEKIMQALADSDKLRESLMERARQSADATHQQTKTALDQFDAQLKAGSEMLQKFMRGGS